MNNKGDVVGQADWYVDDGWIGEAFLCKGGVMQNLNDVVDATVPGGLPDDFWRMIYAYDINERGQVVGIMMWYGPYLQDDPDWEPGSAVFRFTPEDDTTVPVTPAKLEMLVDVMAGHDTVTHYDGARAINDAGDVTVWKDDLVSGKSSCVWTMSGDLIAIPTPAGSAWGMKAMNNRPVDETLGQIVGSVSAGGTSCYAVRYTPGLGVVPLGWLKNPGNNPIGVATDINEAGQVAGYATTSGGTAMHAFRYTDGKGLKDLGALAGLNTKAFGINSSGDVVGETFYSDRAFLYRDSCGMIDLKTTIVTNDPDHYPVPPGFEQMTLTAKKINDAGWIIGRLGGHACLLKPLP
jgi:probable HAF family extracellular repeat protein